MYQPMYLLATSILIVLQFLGGCGHKDIPFQIGTEIVYIDDGVSVVRCGMNGRQLVPQLGGHFASVYEYCYLDEPGVLICIIEIQSADHWSSYVAIENCRKVIEFATPNDLSDYLETEKYPSIADLRFVKSSGE